MQSGEIICEKYRLDQPLGEGGIGVVWSAWQLGLERPVAIKFIKGMPSRTDAARFSAEARALGRLDHANCVRIFDYGRTDSGAPFIVMELLAGPNLGDLRGQRLPIPRLEEILRQIAAGLAAAHDQGIIHRDLKPENVALIGSPPEETAKVLDFGLAKIMGLHETDITKTGEVFGTTWYCSPEQLRGSRDVGPATDLYALGVIAFELIEGRLPFDGDSPFEVAVAHLKAPAPPITRADCPESLRTLVAALLEKAPERRPAGARAVIHMLDRREPARSEPVPVTPPARPVVRPSHLLLAVIACAAVTGALFGMFKPRTAEEEVTPQPPRVAAAAPAGAALIRQEGELRGPTGTAVADAGRIDDAGTVGGSPGCGARAPFLGSGEFESGRGRVVAVVPASYDPRKAYPVVVMLHERAQGADNFLSDSRIDAVAGAHGFIVLIPSVDFVNSWQSPLDLARLEASVAWAKEKLCVDADRIFAIGHVTGGEMTERLACELPIFAGIATTSTRAIVDAETCEKAIPYFQVSPLSDGYSPVEGGRSCSGSVKVSLAEQEERWRRKNGCTGKPAVTKHEGATCYAWECATPYVSCQVDAGHNWPHAGTRLLDVQGCDGQRATLPYGEMIWEFFAALPPRKPRNVTE